MWRKTISLLLIAFTLLGHVSLAAAQDGLPTLGPLPPLVRPGKTVHISFTATEAGEAALYVTTPEGAAVTALQEGIAAVQGQNSFFWNGHDAEGFPLAPGDYVLQLVTAKGEASAALSIGPISPQLNMLRISHPEIHPGEEWSISAFTNMAGTLRLSLLQDGQEAVQLLEAAVPQGELRIPWDGSLDGQPAQPGRRNLSLTLTDKDGFSSNAYHVLVTIPEADEPVPEPSEQPEQLPEQPPEAVQPGDEETPGETVAMPEATPAPASHYKIPSLEDIDASRYGSDYWTLPVGQWDEAKIWEIMMQPMTVLEGRDQRETYKLRLTPDKKSSRDNIVGEITYVSQGVHVLETLDNGWTLVEAYNSSYGPNNRSRRGYGDTDEIIRGYVETSVLQQKTPRDDYGLLIDKLKQELYVFQEGKLLTTLIISTGQPTRQQPWNETPAGEFLMVSRVGDFNAGNLVCRMAMRINGGALIHEVPYILNQNTGHWDYTIQERALGEKASHGCIRVQRKNNEDGINMTWLWNNIKVNTKVLVWDDTNRYYEYPPDDLQLYYNPDRGQFYHSNQNCPSIRNVYLPLKGSMLYAELDDAAYAKLTACRSCNPPERRSRIDELNRANGY